jgi:glyoxylase-like metal-dependent hydrolase (beta-lactamase superfamily II)
MHRNARANMIQDNLPGPGRIVYTDQQSVFLGGVEVQMRYLGRGHTNGDSVIYFPDLRAVHTGDLVVWGKRSQGTTLTPFMDYPRVAVLRQNPDRRDELMFNVSTSTIQFRNYSDGLL